MLWHADRLLALWEAGEAYALEPGSLATRGPHHWSDETRGLPFSAHPRIEPDGTLWNFGSAPWANALVLYRIQPNGTLGEVSVVPMSEPSYVHDFVATERYLVFLLPPLHFSSTGEVDTFLSRHHWNGDAPTRWLVVDKGDLSRRRWFEAPASFIFHFGNGWEDGDTLKLDASLYPDASIMLGDQRDVMWGKWRGASLPEATTLSLDLASGEVGRDDHGLQ